MTEPATAALDTVTEVETPEHVRFRYRIAGPTRRALAYAVDLLVRAVILSVFMILAAMSGAFTREDANRAGGGVVLLVLFALEWAYYVVFESIGSGLTPGKRAARLRVVKEGGHPITFVDAVLRNLLRAADFLPLGYVLGLLVMTRDTRFRRLGDLVAGTMVVIEERARVEAAPTLEPPPTAEEIAELPGRLPLDAAELEAVDLFVRRCAVLAPDRELELAEIAAPALARRLGVTYRNPSRLLGLVHWKANVRTQGAGKRVAP